MTSELVEKGGRFATELNTTISPSFQEGLAHPLPPPVGGGIGNPFSLYPKNLLIFPFHYDIIV